MRLRVVPVTKGGLLRALFSRGALVAVGLAWCSGGVVAGCGSDPPSKLAQPCRLSSDCNGALVCTFGICHAQCSQSKDCAPKERCVKSNSEAVCQFLDESACV